MPIEKVVINSSPLICLFKSNLQNLIPELFSEIIVPGAVIDEVTGEPSRAISLEFEWIKKQSAISLEPLVASWDLGRGESEVLSFAYQNPTFWAIIDDREAARCAKSLSINHTGTIGVIVLAHRRGLISSLKENLKKLQNAGLWVSDKLIEDVCKNELQS